MRTNLLGIISDIHGNYPALVRVLAELRARGCADILCLGDLSGYYSMINECIDLVRREKIVVLKGNHDSYLLGESSCPRSRSVNACIAYQASVLTAENRRFLEGLLPTRDTDVYHAVHGGWRDPLDQYIDQFDFDAPELPAGEPRLYLSGHTHIQSRQCRGDQVYINPGSVGQPRDYDWRAAYALLDGNIITLHRVEYDVHETAAAMQAAGFSEYYYRNLYHGCKIGEKLTEAEM